MPEEKQPVGAELSLPRAADAAALHRVTRRRRRQRVQRTARVDVRYSDEEQAKILTKARSLNIAGAHLVGAAVMAYIDGDLTLPGQRTQLDDYIDELNALRRQVVKIGDNVNQIARKLNSGGPPQPVDTALLAQTARTLEAVDAAVKAIAAAANQAVSPRAAR